MLSGRKNKVTRRGYTLFLQSRFGFEQEEQPALVSNRAHGEAVDRSADELLASLHAGLRPTVFEPDAAPPRWSLQDAWLTTRSPASLSPC